MDRFYSFYEDRFDPDWKDRDKNLWENFPYFLF